jgi:hypothetical protein
MEGKQKTWKSLGGLVVMAALFLAGCTSPTTTVRADAPSSAPARMGSPSPSSSSAEQAGARFNTRWCVAVNLYLRGMKNGLAAQPARKLQDLARSADRFERLATDLEHAGFPTTSWAVLSLSKPIRSFVDAVTPPLAPIPPSQLWGRMRDNAEQMRHMTGTEGERGPSSVIGSIASSLGTC